MLAKKVILLILDGWGKSPNKNESAIANARTPFIDKLLDKYSSAELITYGNRFGLPSNQMGNSEVGHLNISAGRIVYQDLLKIDNSISDKSFRENKVILNAIDYSKKKNNSHMNIKNEKDDIDIENKIHPPQPHIQINI